MRVLRCLRSADLWLLAALCSFSSCAESGKRVTQQELGDRWPLRSRAVKWTATMERLSFAMMERPTR